jgi:hypothetical protein
LGKLFFQFERKRTQVRPFKPFGPAEAVAAGRIANIYQTEIVGVQGFFVALQLDNLDNLDLFVEDNAQDESRAMQSSDRPKHPRKSKAEGEIRTRVVASTAA